MDGHFYFWEVDIISKTIEQLKAKQAEAQHQLAQERHKLQRLKNRVDYCEQGERRKRAHRLITGGAAVESAAPEIRGMGEAEFYQLAQRVFSLPEVKALLPREDG